MKLFSHPRLVASKDYPAKLVQDITKSTRRVAVITTTFHDDCDDTHAIVAALCAASERGVDVSVCADSFTYTEPQGSILSPHRHQLRGVHALKLERRFKRSGVNFQWLGKASNIGFAGRTHSKWVIIDEVVYSFGGINIDLQSFSNIDYMLRFENSTLADQLYDEHTRTTRADRSGHALHNHQFGDEETMVLLDGGIPTNSIIYRRACKLAAKAKRITLVSQYCPTGKLNRLIKRADSTLYFNHWRQARWLNMLVIWFGMKTSGQHTHYNRRPYLHAKFIIFEMDDGKKIAISGSHNFVRGGAILGTREVAIETTNKHIIRQLEAFIKNEVA